MIPMKFIALLLALAPRALADITRCACDISNPETMGARECGLCKEAEKQPADVPVFFLKDVNPRKPNRWLALPRTHGKVGDSFAEMSPARRTELWAGAMVKAK